MNANNCWQLFLETGAPELYLMYTQAKRTEGANVSEDTGTCSAGECI